MRDSRGRRIQQRTIPGSLLITLFCYKSFAQVGFFFLAVTLVVLKFSGADASVFFLFAEEQKAQAKIVGVEEMNFTINERTVYKFHYSFSDPWGFTHEDYSYVTRPGRRWTGDTVTVTFPKEYPEYSRLSFGDRSLFGYWEFAFLLVDLVLLAISLPRSIKSLRLLKQGREGKAKLLRKEKTNTTINDQPVIKLVFSYRDDGGQTHEFTIKTHRPRALLDDDEESILFFPDEPKKVVLMDTLPPAVTIHHDKIDFDIKPSMFKLVAPSLSLLALIVLIIPF